MNGKDKMKKYSGSYDFGKNSNINNSNGIPLSKIEEG
jgi:hypothetical protein